MHLAGNIFLRGNWKELAAQPSAYEISIDMWDEELELETWRDVNVALNADPEVVDFVSEVATRPCPRGGTCG